MLKLLSLKSLRKYSSVFRTFVDIFGNYVQKSSESCWKSLAVAGTFAEIPVMER